MQDFLTHHAIDWQMLLLILSELFFELQKHIRGLINFDRMRKAWDPLWSGNTYLLE